MSGQSAADYGEPGALRAVTVGPVAAERPDSPESPSPVAAHPPWRPSTRERMAEAWRSRHLLVPLAARIVPTYRGRVLGRAWLVLRPLMQLTGFAIVFGGVFHATAPHGLPYLLYLIFSIQAFRLFEYTVMYETLSSRMVKQVTRTMRIPLLLIPIAATFRAVLTLFVYWGLAVALLVYYGIARGHLYLLLTPKLAVGLGGLALCLLYGLALGLITSVVYPRVPDIRYLVGYGLHLWLFLTPVFYSLESLPHTFQRLAQVNPLTPLVGLVQYGFLGGDAPGVHGLAWSLAVIGVTGAIGLWVYNRLATKWIGLWTLTDDADDTDEDEFL